MTCKESGKHLRPVHFNRGSHSHIWLCLACRKHLAGPVLPDSERNALIDFTAYLTTPGEGKTEETNVMNQISVTVTGKDRTDLVRSLRSFADNLDGTPAEEAGLDDDNETEETPRALKKNTTKGKKAAAASMDDDDDNAMEADSDDDEDSMEASADDDDEDEDFVEPVSKKKSKKVTIADVNDACKKRSKAGGKEGRAQVLKILKKKFGTETVSEIKPEKYADVIKALAV